jgi:hypothetical protein
MCLDQDGVKTTIEAANKYLVEDGKEQCAKIRVTRTLQHTKVRGMTIEC